MLYALYPARLTSSLTLPQSWSALATCYEDLREPDKALQVEVMGAHLKTDGDHWMQLGAKSR